MTLGDLLVSTAVLGLLLGATQGLLVQGQQAYAVGAARVEAQQHARIALERLTAEIRAAGRAPAGAGFAAIAVAEPRRIVLQHDLNGDGVIAGTGETVTWRLAAPILRREAGGGAQPVVNGVTELVLTYFDAAGLPALTPADVRVVRILLTTHPDTTRPRAARNLATTVATEVRLRNR